MKKVVLAVEGNQFSAPAFSFIEELNLRSPLQLTGAFLPLPDYARFWGYAGSPGPVFTGLAENEGAIETMEAVKIFEEACERSGIEYRVHLDDSDFALPRLQKETRFADLLVIASDRFYNDTEPGNPNTYLRSALRDMECPVLLIPDSYTFPTSIVLAYDGSPSSVYAIKQFAYLLPELGKLPVMLLYAAEDEFNDFPDEPYIRELLGRHFADCNLYHLPLTHERDLATWLSEKPNSLVVAGGFGGSMFSRIMHNSFLATLIREQRYPIFNAHR